MPRSRARTPLAAREKSAAARRRLTRELRALAHPLRLRLIGHFAEPRTTMQVAARMGEPPTRLYHHVNALARAGILRLARTRQVRGTTEKYFELARRRIGVARGADATRASRAALAGLANVVFDEARDELLSAIARPGRFRPESAPLALRMVLAVPASHQKRVRERIMATFKAIQRESKGRGGERAPRWSLTVGFSPVRGKG